MRFLILCYILILVSFRIFSQEFEYPSFWHLEADSANFSRRDSSPNAVVEHNGSLWVLGGWTYEDSVWHSKSDVWKSSNGVDWSLINDKPPYHPYCAFISYKGYIWAFGDSSFRTVDGVTWEFVETSLPFGFTYRVTLFKDEIWLSTGNQILKSPDGFNWSIILENTPWEIRFWPGFISFDNRLWFFGGGINYLTGDDYYFNDVWSSENGLEWSLVRENAAWPGRYWFGYQVYDDKLWILGGWDYHKSNDEFSGNLNDVWYSEDGNNWHPLISSDVWHPRHAVFTWVFNGSLWISAGYGGVGVSTLYNDVWKLTNEWRTERVHQVIHVSDTVFVYGDQIDFNVTTSSGLETQYLVKDAQESTFDADEITISPGEYIVKIIQPGNSIFETEKKYVAINIQKRDLFVKAPDYNIKFGDDIPDLKFEFDGFVYGDNETTLEELPVITVHAAKFSPVGSYPIQITGGVSSKYNFVFVEGALHVEPGDDVIFYPNPTRQNVNIFMPQPVSHFEVRISNSTGQILLNQHFQESSFIVDIGHLPAGYYILEIRSESVRRIIRLSKL